MRSLLAAWLITLLSLTNLSAAGQPMHLIQSGQPVTVEQYWELVENTRQAVIEIKTQPQADIRQQLDELAQNWEAIESVELEDGTVVSIRSASLVAELRASPADLQRLENLLDALLRAHKEFPGQVFTMEDIEPLKEILARPQFQWGQAQAVEMPDWLGNILEAISNILGRIVFFVTNLAYEGRFLLVIAGALLFLFVLFYISRNLSRSLVRDAQLAAEGEGDEALLTSNGALQRAQNLSMRGDYRNAVRYLYLSSLLVLDEQGLLRYDRSRTNREYLRSISSRPELANPLRDVIDVFDRVWYGFENVDEETYKSYVEHVDELREKKE